MAACALCGSSTRLRFDRAGGRWLCAGGCGGERRANRASRRAKRTGLFEGWWRDPATGQRLGRVRRDELAEVYRLWRAHRDIREGRVAA